VWEDGILPTVFLQGLRVDLILAGMAVAPLSALSCLCGVQRYKLLVCLEESSRVLGGSGDYAGMCLWKLPRTDGYQPVRMYDPNRLFIELFEISHGKFFRCVGRVQPTVFLSLGLPRRHWRCSGSTTALASRTVSSATKERPVCAPVVSDLVYVRCAQPPGHRSANPSMFA